MSASECPQAAGSSSNPRKAVNVAENHVQDAETTPVRIVGTCNWCKRAIYSDQKWSEAYSRYTQSSITGYVTVQMYHSRAWPLPRTPPPTRVAVRSHKTQRSRQPRRRPVVSKPKSPFLEQLRRNQRIRAFGHNPAASNCRWNLDWDFTSAKESCDTCAKAEPKTPCSHPFRHTVYGASDPKRNGTTCVACGAVVS